MNEIDIKEIYKNKDLNLLPTRYLRQNKRSLSFREKEKYLTQVSKLGRYICFLNNNKAISLSFSCFFIIRFIVFSIATGIGHLRL